MADDVRTITGIDWRSTFPFAHLFRSFRIAIHPSKLLLGLVLLLSFYCGGRFLDALWHWQHRADVPVDQYGQMATPGWGNPNGLFVNDGRGPFITFFDYEAYQINNLARSVFDWNWFGQGGITTPEMNMPGIAPGVIPAIYGFLYDGPARFFGEHPWYCLTLVLWLILLLSVFGGAIARIAAIQVARDEKLSIRQALRFSTGKVLSFIFAPLIPLIILFVLGVLISIGGLLNYIPYIGSIIVGLIFFLTLAVGFVMTLVLLGTAAGFPLMYPTIAVEGSDSFDAISRSFSYVYARPWRMLFYSLISLIYGAATYLFLRLFVLTLLGLVYFFESWWLNQSTNLMWHTMWPPPQYFRFPYTIDWVRLTVDQKVGAWFIAFWVYMIIGLLGSYLISFFFSANTIIYYLLRQEVDATELEDVFVESSDEEFADAPVIEPPMTPPPPDVTPPPAVA